MSAGDLLRAERNIPDSQFGELIEDHIRNGTIVPVEITCSLLAKAMAKHSLERAAQGDTAFGHGRFLIDGFPRNQNNFDGWQSTMSEKTDLKFVLFFDCLDDLCVKRCLQRGAAGSGRTDDNEESLRKRFSTFATETLPIIQYYQKLDLVKRIDASSNPEDVYKEVRILF